MSFPKGFIWGTGSASYQIEGAWDEDGKGPSVWDEFSRLPGKIRNGDTGDVACDAYHRYPEDISLIKQMGLKAYRFSLSWPRIMPSGRGAVNEKGLAYYDAIVDMLLENGIEPYVTLFHWDLPSALQRHGGWLSRKTAEAFGEFASLVGRHFRGRVKNYFTLNEPQCFISQGYACGRFAPGLVLPDADVVLSMHNALLAHGMSVRALRDSSGGPVNIGIVSTGRICYPANNTPKAADSAREAMFSFPEDWYFTHQWVLDPVILGRYPDNAPSHMISFAKGVPAGDWDIITQATDCAGINLYHGCAVGENGEEAFHRGYPRTAIKWPVTPQIMRYGMAYIYERYKLPLIVAENGLSCSDRIYLDGKVHDPGRIDFLTQYLRELKKACEEGTDIKGYFHWSFTDNFEWASGYDERFGLVYIDYPTQRRIMKDSAAWYAKVAAENAENL